MHLYLSEAIVGLEHAPSAQVFASDVGSGSIEVGPNLREEATLEDVEADARDEPISELA